ncbi:MAG: hypothetical protein M3020_03125 [Myxococcota bacterium]|jgi:hypothetical protein|nr:hypothetical protein [Myxococcota bacterium]
MTRRIGAILGVLGVFTACGGAATPEPAAPTDAAPDTDVEAAEPAEAPAEAAPESSSTSGEANTDPAQVQEVLQLVLDDEALNPYLHLEQPDRFPLRVATRNLPPGVELVKATKPVVLVDKPDDEKKPLLVFTEVDVGKDSASVRYRYDVEGIRGACTLERRDGRWILKKSRVTER